MSCGGQIRYRDRGHHLHMGTGDFKLMPTVERDETLPMKVSPLTIKLPKTNGSHEKGKK